MDSFAELVINRRSVRQFTDEPLLPNEVEKIVKAGLMAPSSKNCRPCHFILIEDKAMLKALAHCRPTGSAFLEGATVGIAVLVDHLTSTAHTEDSAIAATYLQLQAEDLGLGSCWIQIAGRRTEDGFDSEQYVRELLDIPLQLTVECIVAIGHKAHSAQPHDEDKLHWEKVHIEKFRYDAAE